MANNGHQSDEARDGSGKSAMTAEFLQCVVDVAGRFTVGGHESMLDSDKVVERHAAAADARVFAPGDAYESVFEQN